MDSPIAEHIGLPLRALKQQHASRVTTICGDRVRTGAEFADRVSALSRALSERLGVQPGDRVCVAAHSSDCFFEALLAVAACGAIFAPLNWRWSVKEASVACELCSASVLIFDAANLQTGQTLPRLRPSVRHTIFLGNKGDAPALQYGQLWCSEELINRYFGSELVLKRAPDSTCLICFTSGTTGSPKAVALSHKAFHTQSLTKLAIVKYDRSDVYLHTAPLFHIGGLSSGLAMLMVGAVHIFMLKFSAEDCVELAERYSATTMIAVPAMLVDVVNYASRQKGRRLESVKTLLVGAGGMTEKQEMGARWWFPNAEIYTAYGMTEACSSITFAKLDPWEKQWNRKDTWGAFVGHPAPGIEVAIHETGDYGDGEVLTRGPHLMSYYWCDPEKTEETLTKDGWLRTGDMGKLDGNGGLWLVGRVKDMIKSGGENVHASEVEAVLKEHQAIEQVAVVGVRDERMGEVVSALIQLNVEWGWKLEGSRGMVGNVVGIWLGNRKSAVGQRDLSVDSIFDHCVMEGLSRFKIPRFIVGQRGELPASPMGKIKKPDIKRLLHELRERLENCRVSKL